MRNRHTWFKGLIEAGKTREEAYEIVWGWKDKCEQCGKSLSCGRIVMVHEDNMVRLCVECTVERLNKGNIIVKE